MDDGRPGYYEFFAGGGMARAGLGPGWRCLFANDIDARKALSYQRNWGAGTIHVGDVAALEAADLPGRADLIWGSFPCQDLSLAGAGAGLAGARSGTFRPFWRLIGDLVAEGRAPGLVAVENVTGALTSHGGADFAEILRTFAAHGYRAGALVIDAALFTPQSRPRLFVIGAHEGLALDPGLLAPGPAGPFHSKSLVRAVERLPAPLRDAALWWNPPPPPRRNAGLADIIEDAPESVPWHSAEQTERLLALMAPAHRARVEAAARAGRRMVGCVYRRTRPDGAGGRVQRAEVRFDDLAGCLRTPAGGSSRQTLLIVEGARIRSRLISSRETARLMGLPDEYRLPERYNEAYHLVGDGVVVDAVAHLRRHLFEPALQDATWRDSREARLTALPGVARLAR
jgi:DNA (cytosine-5)-methyltransferase 1